MCESNDFLELSASYNVYTRAAFLVAREMHIGTGEYITCIYRFITLVSINFLSIRRLLLICNIF